MATKELSAEEAASLYERKLREMNPDKVLEDRLEETKDLDAGQHD